MYFIPIMHKSIFLLLMPFWWVAVNATEKVREEAFGVKERLSEYGFFKGDLASHQPGDGVVPYAINTPLFSDYAEKFRFLYIPKGTSLVYSGSEKLSLPEGAVLIKTFYYEGEGAKPRQLLETRLLIKEAGSWKALVYVWNKTQDDALLDVAGTTIPVVRAGGKKEKLPMEWVVPNVNQCKGCHSWQGEFEPIGPKVSQLNREVVTAQGDNVNQIKLWKEQHILEGLPEDLNVLPKMAVWNDGTTGNLDQRARAWLDVNCAHCHRKEGPAASSGLHLNIEETDKTAVGVLKSPVAAGKGSGGMRYALVPGKPKESFLLYRMKSTDPGIMMPELGRQVNHSEGIDLIKQWILEMR